jgi:hypothetical protein
VEDGQDKLLAVEQAVRDELGRADGDGAGGVLWVSTLYRVRMCARLCCAFRCSISTRPHRILSIGAAMVLLHNSHTSTSRNVPPYSLP